RGIGLESAVQGTDLVRTFTPGEVQEVDAGILYPTDGTERLEHHCRVDLAGNEGAVSSARAADSDIGHVVGGKSGAGKQCTGLHFDAGTAGRDTDFQPLDIFDDGRI